jgi:RNA-binding protein
MEALKGYQKKFLKGLAHGLKPVVFIGQKGLTANLIDSIREALSIHELIKVKFVDFKDKQHKISTADAVAAELDCQLVGMIGHMVIFYRRQGDPEKRKIKLPQR